MSRRAHLLRPNGDAIEASLSQSDTNITTESPNTRSAIPIGTRREGLRPRYSDDNNCGECTESVCAHHKLNTPNSSTAPPQHSATRIPRPPTSRPIRFVTANGGVAISTGRSSTVGQHPRTFVMRNHERITSNISHTTSNAVRNLSQEFDRNNLSMGSSRNGNWSAQPHQRPSFRTSVYRPPLSNVRYNPTMGRIPTTDNGGMPHASYLSSNASLIGIVRPSYMQSSAPPLLNNPSNSSLNKTSNNSIFSLAPAANNSRVSQSGGMMTNAQSLNSQSRSLDRPNVPWRLIPLTCLSQVYRPYSSMRPLKSDPGPSIPPPMFRNHRSHIPPQGHTIFPIDATVSSMRSERSDMSTTPSLPYQYKSRIPTASRPELPYRSINFVNAGTLSSLSNESVSAEPPSLPLIPEDERGASNRPSIPLISVKPPTYATGIVTAKSSMTGVNPSTPIVVTEVSSLDESSIRITRSATRARAKTVANGSKKRSATPEMPILVAEKSVNTRLSSRLTRRKSVENGRMEKENSVEKSRKKTRSTIKQEPADEYFDMQTRESDAIEKTERSIGEGVRSRRTKKTRTVKQEPMNDYEERNKSVYNYPMEMTMGSMEVPLKDCGKKNEKKTLHPIKLEPLDDFDNISQPRNTFNYEENMEMSGREPVIATVEEDKKKKRRYNTRSSVKQEQVDDYLETESQTGTGWSMPILARANESQSEEAIENIPLRKSGRIVRKRSFFGDEDGNSTEPKNKKKISIKQELIEEQSNKKEMNNQTHSIPKLRKHLLKKDKQGQASIPASPRVVIKLKKTDNDQYMVSDDSPEDEEIELSDGEGSLVDPNEEYSEKYYQWRKRDLMEVMSEEAARQIVNVERKMHVKRVSIEDSLKWIVLGGRFEMKIWYDTVYPEEYAKHDKLWICDGCFHYFTRVQLWRRHTMKCKLIFAPPGNEVYRDMKGLEGRDCLSVFRVQGNTQEIYCQRLCQFAMLFIKDKCVHRDVDQYDFFVVTEFSRRGGFRPCGYFSKQRLSNLELNLNCFCVFPCYQQKGIGRFIIDFSYQLSIMSKMPGRPERPLSSFGLISYTSYWKRSVVLALENTLEINMNELSLRLGMHQSDIVEVIQNLFSTKLKENELAVSERIVSQIAEKEKLQDEKRIYAKGECFCPDFVEYMHNYKKNMEEEEK